LTKSPGHVESLVTDTRLVGERRGQILRAAVKLFSDEGYYTTTISQIAKEAGVSTGLIYQYFGDKDDILFLSLKLVLETYETEIPPRLEGVKHPVERLCGAIWAYCSIVDGLRQATVLAYRSTKSLRADRRALVKADEIRTNRLLQACLRACIAGGYLREVDEYLLAYQYVNFCHAWALKHWALRSRFNLGRYVNQGIGLLVEPFLTAKGRAALNAMRRRTADFTRETKPPAPSGRPKKKRVPKPAE
jgi:AcrR family transcriptional regulator